MIAVNGKSFLIDVKVDCHSLNFLRLVNLRNKYNKITDVSGPDPPSVLAVKTLGTGNKHLQQLLYIDHKLSNINIIVLI